MNDPASTTPAARDAGPLIDYATRVTAELSADWPRWQIWYVHRVYGGTIYCARRWDWKPGDPVLNARTPEELTGYLEEQAGGAS